MQQEPEIETGLIEDTTHASTKTTWIPREDPDIVRHRKVVLISLIICIILSLTNIVIAIFGFVMGDDKGDAWKNLEIVEPIVSLCFYGLGLFFVFRYLKSASSLFATGSKWLVALKAIIILAFSIFFCQSLYAFMFLDEDRKPTKKLLVTTFMYLIVSITKLVLLLFIVVRTDKIHKIIQNNMPSTDEQD